MSQHDYNIANGGGAAVRSDLNLAFAAILSQNSGATAPTTTKPFMFWYDTTTGVLKMRNAADTAWVAAIDGITGGNSQGLKNRIINGAMVIDQRNAGASVTPTSSGTYTLDRWRADLSQASKYSVQQNAGGIAPPSGFSNYLGATSLSAYTVVASEQFTLRHFIEGFNSADLGWGTSGAQTVTLSFWVRSSLTGTFGGTIVNSAQDRFYGFSFTVSTANMWEQKTITIAGDTTGTWLTNNGIGIAVRFSLGSGSSSVSAAGSWGGSPFTGVTGQVNLVGTSGATFYITGVQLEKGSTATAFDYRPYGAELALCQRYFIKTPATTTYGVLGYDGYVEAGYFFGQPYTFPVTMRSAPTGAIGGTFGVSRCGQPSVIETDSFSAFVTSAGTSTGNGYFHVNSSGFATFSAEL